MLNIIQDLSNVYVTLQEIEIKGKQSVPYAICLQTLEKSINELNTKAMEIAQNKQEGE